MEYTIYLIDNQTQLERCPVFYVEHFNWTIARRPLDAWLGCGIRDFCSA